MIYLPDWEPLSVCVQRLMALGASEDEAKVGLSHAIADRKLDLRILIGGDDEFAGRTFERQGIDQPIRLSPADFDWIDSRPTQPWTCGIRTLDIEKRSIEMLEICTADLEALFPGATSKKLKAIPAKLSQARIAAIFDEWRESQHDVPTEKEDLDFMKSKGVSRAAVRRLRADYPRRSRGEKRTEQ